jgi:hypothetical protein
MLILLSENANPLKMPGISTVVKFRRHRKQPPFLSWQSQNQHLTTKTQRHKVFLLGLVSLMSLLAPTVAHPATADIAGNRREPVRIMISALA